MEVDEHEAEDFAQVEACDHFFKGLLAGARGVFIDLDVVGGLREDGVLVIEGTVFAVNCHGHVWGQVEVLEFGD